MAWSQANPPAPVPAPASSEAQVPPNGTRDPEWWKNTGNPRGQWWLTYPGYEPTEAKKIWERVPIPPSPVRSPEDALSTLLVDEGFRVELVASEPQVIRPVFMKFDAAGRLWVAEMPGYMRDVAGTGEDDPTGRIVVLEDLDGDGRMDKSTVFLDHLVMPRTLAFVDGGVLVAEPPRIWYARDKDGDLVADEKTVVAEDYGERGNPEHSANGLLPALDNWMYSAKSAVRYRFSDGKLTAEPTLFRGQWGIGQNDAGRLFYNYNASPLHADLVPGEYFVSPGGVNLAQARNLKGPPLVNVALVDDKAVYPARVTPLVTLGASDLRPDGTLKQFTSASDPHVYRATLFPEAYRGNVFVADPVGNLVKRLTLEWQGGRPRAAGVSEGREFLASTDERFRPVCMETGPDGALYVADMYTGIVEHKRYVTEYLREQIFSREIGNFAPTGRIYRIVPVGAKAVKPVRLDRKTPEQWVDALSSDNGWVRDTAQRLLVQSGSERVVPRLRRVLKNGENALGRLHALWTLDGLKATDMETFLTASRDADPWVRAAALRVSETLPSNTESSRFEAYRRLAKDPDFEVRLQLMLTLGRLQTPPAREFMVEMLSRESDTRMATAAAPGLQIRVLEALDRLMEHPEWKKTTELREVVLEQLGLIVLQRRRAPLVSTLFATLDRQSRDDWRVKAVLRGLGSPSIAAPPLEMTAEPEFLISSRASGSESMRELAAAVAAKLTWPGDTRRKASDTRPLTASEETLFELGRQNYALICVACHQPTGQGLSGVAPPLAGTSWVTGSSEIPINIILHGLTGPIDVNGENWNMLMPGLGMPGGLLDDEKIAGIVTFIRRQWGNMAAPVSPADVAQVRAKSAGRTAPWSAAELSALQKAGGP